MPISSFTEANIAIATHYLAMREALPEEDRSPLDNIVGDPVPPGKVSLFLEFGYAKREHLSEEHKGVVADVGQFATANGFWGLSENGRGQKMIAVLRGEALPEGEDSPMVATQYASSPAVLPSSPPQGA